MQDVRTTVLETLNRSGYGSYQQYAEPVITALVDRERDICGVLIEYASREGMDRAAIERALAHTGMAVPASAPVQSTQQPWQQPQQQQSTSTWQTPQPQQNMGGSQPTQQQSSQEDESSVQAVLGQIQNTLSGLVAFARRNGFNG